MKEVIAMHGWSGDSHTWNIWTQYFKAHGWHWKSCERGYGDLPPFSPSWHEEISEGKTHHRRVFIGHSLGPHIIDRNVISNATDVVLLASFGAFIPEGSANRTLKQALKGMQERLGTNEEKIMLRTFLEKACEPMPSSAVTSGPIEKGLSIKGREKLKADLRLLIQTKGLPIGFPKDARVLIVEDAQDQIVVPSSRASLLKELNQLLMNEPTHWVLNGAGHALLEPELVQRVYHWLMKKK